MKDSTITGRSNWASLPSFLKSVLVGVFWLLAWQLVYVFVGKDLIVPSPFDAFSALGIMIFTGEFYVNVGATMYRVITGILLSFAVGVVTALVSYLFLWVRDILSFMVVFLKSTPVMAVIIFAILWLTSGNVPIFACFLMCYPVVYTNILSGLDNMDSRYLEMGVIFRLKTMTKLRFLYFPSILPHIKAALSLISGLSWKTVVAAEVLSNPQFSMGYNLLDAKVYLETDQLFAWIIAIVGLSILFERLIKFLLNIHSLKVNRPK